MVYLASLMLAVTAAAPAVTAAAPADIVLLDFSATWCGPCQMMRPVVTQLSRSGCPVREVDIDRERELAKQFRVESVPCFVLVAQGQEVGRVVGATRYENLWALYQKGLAQIGETPSGPPRPARPEDAGPIETKTRIPDQYRDPATGAIAATPVAARSTPATAHAPTAAHAPATVGPGAFPGEALAMAASVRLKVADPDGHSTGSGTVIDAREREALILTCGHIFRDSKGRGRVTVDFFGPGAEQGLEGTVIGYDLKSDIGLVSVATPRRMPSVRLASPTLALQPGDAVFSIGCPRGADPELARTKVNSLNKYLGPPNVQVAGMPIQGRSGGGLFTTEGDVIGVCNAADPQDSEGLFAALPTILAALENAGLAEIARGGALPAAVAEASPPLSASSDPFARATPAASAPVSTGDPTAAPASIRMPLASRGSAPVGDASLATLPPPPSPAGRRSPGNPFAAAEQALGAAAAHEHAEVICVIRSLKDPQAKSEVVVLDRASPEFIHQLQSEQTRQQSRTPTSYSVPGPSLATRPAAAARAAADPRTAAAAPSWQPKWIDPHAR